MIVPANIHPEPLRYAMRAQRDSIAERMAALPEPIRSATHTHVLFHLEGSAVRPWSLPGRVCTFGSVSDDPAIDRVFVALEDASEARPRGAIRRFHFQIACCSLPFGGCGEAMPIG